MVRRHLGKITYDHSVSELPVCMAMASSRHGWPCHSYLLLPYDTGRRQDRPGAGEIPRTSSDERSKTGVVTIALDDWATRGGKGAEN